MTLEVIDTGNGVFKPYFHYKDSTTEGAWTYNYILGAGCHELKIGRLASGLWNVYVDNVHLNGSGLSWDYYWAMPQTDTEWWEWSTMPHGQYKSHHAGISLKYSDSTWHAMDTGANTGNGLNLYWGIGEDANIPVQPNPTTTPYQTYYSDWYSTRP